MDDCPGEGKCHGCVQWCDQCGDVDLTCDANKCDCHRCYVCHILVTRAEAEFNYCEFNDASKVCFACWAKYTMRDALDRANRLERPDEEMNELEYVERTIGRYLALHRSP